MFRKIKDFLEKRRERWDSICIRCGLCCYEKELKDGVVIIKYDSPCEYLDKRTNLCTQYKNRFKICPECKKMTLFNALFSRYIPETCGYVLKYRKKGAKLNINYLK